jgi:hypothetical protein
MFDGSFAGNALTAVAFVVSRFAISLEIVVH